MNNTLGTEESAFLAFALFAELIDTLVAKGVLDETDAESVFHRFVVAAANSDNAVAKRGAHFLIKSMDLGRMTGQRPVADVVPLSSDPPRLRRLPNSRG